MLPWDIGSDLPWRFFTSPVEKWAVQPSFVVGEYLFIVLAGVARWHALKKGRGHVLCWVAAILAGTANDLIFMALPLVDNFWQAQGTIMLTPRLPLYIPCVYVCFMYLPTVSVWRLELPPIPRAALTGLAGISFYACYDIIGAKFLWWTWHDTDQPIMNRLLGAPIGSTMWVVIFTATFAYLIGRQLDRDPDASRKTCAKALVIIMLLCSFLMVVQFNVWQIVDGRVPGVKGLVLLLTVYAIISARAWLKTKPLAPKREDKVVFGMLVVYFVTMTIIMAVFSPETHRNLSVHQTYGPCHVEVEDFTRLPRYQFICAEDFDEDFTFECVDELPAEGDVWYMVCGKAHTNKGLWIGGVTGLGVVGTLLFGFMLGTIGPKRPEER